MPCITPRSASTSRCLQADRDARGSEAGSAIANVDRSRVMFPTPGINAGSMLSAGKQIAQLGHGVAEVSDPRLDGNRKAGVAGADVVAAGDVNQEIEAHARHREGLSHVAMLAQ